MRRVFRGDNLNDLNRRAYRVFSPNHQTPLREQSGYTFQTSRLRESSPVGPVRQGRLLTEQDSSAGSSASFAAKRRITLRSFEVNPGQSSASHANSTFAEIILPRVISVYFAAFSAAPTEDTVDSDLENATVASLLSSSAPFRSGPIEADFPAR